MSDDQVTKKVVPTVPQQSDGVDASDEGGNKVIKGTKFTFSNNAEYVAGKGGEVIKSPPREFIFIQRKRFVQEWPPGDGGNDPPLSTVELADHECFPDIEKKNNETPKNRWRMSFGNLKGPFEKVQALYLLEQTTMAAYTFLTGTVGGFRAVRDLMDAVKRARLLGSPCLFPIITLGNTFMPTDWGGRQRPLFSVVRWIEIGKPGERPALTTATEVKPNAEKSVKSKPNVKKPNVNNADLDDDITW
jgi:hypothetical protein